MPFLDLAIDKELREANFFAELIHGYSEGLVEPNMMRGLQPVGPCRTTLKVIIPSRSGLSPDKWKETATLCPLDWPSKYSLLRLRHINGSCRRQRRVCDHKQDTVTCLPRGRSIIKCLQSESCFGGHLSLKLRLSYRPTSEVVPSQIDGCDSDPPELHWRLTKQLSQSCANMLLHTSKPTQPTLNSPTNGMKQSLLISDTIGIIN